MEDADQLFDQMMASVSDEQASAPASEETVEERLEKVFSGGESRKEEAPAENLEDALTGSDGSGLPDDIEALFASQAEGSEQGSVEEHEAAADDDSGEEGDDSPDGVGRGAQKRIQQLVQRAKDAEARAEQQAAYFQNQLQSVEQRYAQLEQRVQAAQQSEIAQALKALTGPKETPYEEMTLQDRIKYEAVQEAEKKLNAQWEARFNELETREQRRERMLAENQERQRREARLNHYTARAAQAREQVLLKDFDPQKAAELAPFIEELQFAHAGAFGVDPVQGAAHLQKILDGYLKGRYSALMNSSKKKKQPKLPASPSSTKRGTGSVKAKPSQEDLEGMDIDQMFDVFTDMGGI